MTRRRVTATKTSPRIAAWPASLLVAAAAVAAHAADEPAGPTASSVPPAAGVTSEGRTGPAALAGRWSVDLRPSADAPAYHKPMILEITSDGSVRGSFYDSTIESGRVGASNGRTCFAFRTTDGVGPYETAGCLVAGRIVGQTWAEHRRFMLNWVAVRE